MGQMSPTMVYKEFKSIFPDISIYKYKKYAGKNNAIVMKGATGTFIFSFMSPENWIFERSECHGAFTDN